MHVGLAQMGSIHLADAAGERLALAAHFGFEHRFVEHFSHVEGPTCACGWAFRHRQRIVVPDIGRSPLFYGTRDLQVALDAGVRAVHATPLVDLRNGAVGVLTLHYGKPHMPSTGDLTRMETLALVVATRAAFSLGH
jgi:GAF domain-containing protein